jgi:hypothetical protein
MTENARVSRSEEPLRLLLIETVGGGAVGTLDEASRLAQMTHS